MGSCHPIPNEGCENRKTERGKREDETEAAQARRALSDRHPYHESHETNRQIDDPGRKDPQARPTPRSGRGKLPNMSQLHPKSPRHPLGRARRTGRLLRCSFRATNPSLRPTAIDALNDAPHPIALANRARIMPPKSFKAGRSRSQGQTRLCILHCWIAAFEREKSHIRAASPFEAILTFLRPGLSCRQNAALRGRLSA